MNRANETLKAVDSIPTLWLSLLLAAVLLGD